MSSHRIVVQPLSRFLASRISAATAAVRQTSSISSTPSSSVVAAISSPLSSSSNGSGALPSSLTLDYQRRGISSTTKNGISIDSHYRSSRQTPLSTLPTWRMNNLPSVTSSLSSPSHHHHRRTFVTSTTSLQTSSSATTEQPAAAATAEDGDECPPWQNPLHHNNPEYTRVLAEEFAPGEEMPIAPLPPFDESDDDDKEIVRLNMLEVKELVDRIGDHFGFTDDDDYMDDDGGGGDGGGDKVEEVVEKTVFDLKLTGFDARPRLR
ncbi:hypothetical protein QTG54_008957 [Skeletonema marinoi]|uniref:Uncharacterized protein n=1 Tax=Skeletonema marinoi TaxID=267567 RepID=A0AAD9DAC1_9STRA|nr:hypothetical protein QTG54_008957 [Skeletonema marinoi]